MRQFFYLMLMLFPFNILYSHEYDSMIVENKLWSEIVITGGFEAIFTTYYKFEGDTNIDGKVYKILYSDYADSLMQYWQMESFFREDSMRVYEYKYNEEILIYDFSILKGDTVFVNEIKDIVYNVDTISINEKFRKRIFFYFSNDIWIEGIGSVNKPFEPLAEYCDIDYELLCCQHYSDIIYQHPDYSTCYIEYISGYKNLKLNLKELIKIEPNPFSDYAYISINKNISSHDNKLYLINLSGQMIKEIEIKNKSALLSRENLMPGLYVIQLITNDGSMLNEKLLIK